MTQLRNNQPEPDEDDFNELDKEFLFSILATLSILFLVVGLACVTAWFLIA